MTLKPSPPGLTAAVLASGACMTTADRAHARYDKLLRDARDMAITSRAWASDNDFSIQVNYAGTQDEVVNHFYQGRRIARLKMLRLMHGIAEEQRSTRRSA